MLLTVNSIEEMLRSISATYQFCNVWSILTLLKRTANYYCNWTLLCVLFADYKKIYLIFSREHVIVKLLYYISISKKSKYIYASKYTARDKITFKLCQKLLEKPVCYLKGIVKLFMKIHFTEIEKNNSTHRKHNS